MERQGSTGGKRRRSAPPESVQLPLGGTRSVCLSEALPVFINRLPGSVDGVALFSLQGPLDGSAVATALSQHLAPGHSLRQASLTLNGLVLPGLVIAAGSAHAAAAIYSMASRAPAVVDGALVGLRGGSGLPT